jgi:hypothetical protein
LEIKRNINNKIKKSINKSKIIRLKLNKITSFKLKLPDEILLAYKKKSVNIDTY